MAGERESALRRLTGRLKWIHLAPVFAMLTLGAWALASPVGAGPDDDYHLASVWCTRGGSMACADGSQPLTREVSTAFENSVCYARAQTRSAACQEHEGLDLNGPVTETDRGNFQHDYPAVFYSTMRVFAGDDLESSAITMRLVNAALFVGLTTALACLLSPSRRQTLLWGWLVTTIPLGVFIIPSNNPSGWAVTGVGTAFVAGLGWFETEGWRRWGLGAIYVVAVVMAAGARADAAMYVIGASVLASVLSFEPHRRWWRLAALPAGGAVLAFLLYRTAETVGSVVESVSQGASSGGSGVSAATPAAAEPAGGAALALYNLLQLPDLWTGVWGTWGLGWLDTPVPAVVPWSMVAAFVVVAFAGMAHLNRRKAIAMAGVLTVLTALPVYLLTVGGNTVGEVVQPRYFLPAIVLLAMAFVTATPGGRAVKLTRVQTLAVLIAMAGANALALQVNIRRYVTGTDHQAFNLDAGREWWWHGLAIGPTAVWAVGSLAFIGMLAVLWRPLRSRALAS